MKAITTKAYDYTVNNSTVTIFAFTKEQATKHVMTEYGMTKRQAEKAFISTDKTINNGMAGITQEEPKQETAQETASPVGVVEQEQEEPKQETLVTIDGDAMTVTFFIRSQQKNEKDEIHGTVTHGQRKLALPKAFTGNGEEVERFIIADTIAQIDADKNRANKTANSDKATEEEQEAARDAIRIFEEQRTLIEKIRAAAGYTADTPEVKDFPVSRILACVVTRTSLPVEYGTAKKALKAVCDVYRVILYENRALTDKEQETVTAVKTALHDVLKPFTAEAKDSKGFKLRVKNTDVVDLFLCSWKMEEDGKLSCTAGSKRGTLEKNLFKVAFGKVLHLEETETK